MPIAPSAEIRIPEGADVRIDPTAVIDDNVRIVVSPQGRLAIGPRSKIGKGTIINCGGEITIGSHVSVYGYCYFQSSVWRMTNGSREYDHGTIQVMDHAVISPYCLISHSAIVTDGEILPPYTKRGNWL